MADDDNAPANGTGAPSESSPKDSDSKSNSESALSVDQDAVAKALKVWVQLVGVARDAGTLAPTGRLDPRARPAAVRLVKETGQTVASLRTSLIHNGISEDEADDFLGPVQRRLGPRAITLMTADEMMNMPDPQFLVDGLIEEGSFGVLYSEPGLGKTFLILSLCFCIAAGIPWFGRTVAKGAVVYVGAEGVGGVPKRLKALLLLFGFDKPPADFHFINQPVNLLDPQSMADAVSAVEEKDVDPVFVVFDTYARCLVGGEENSAKDTGKAIDAVDGLRFDLKTAAWVVHHTGKEGSSERGSGALRGAADTMLILKRKAQDPPGVLRLINDKQKNFPEAADILVRLKAVGDSVVPEDVTNEVAWARTSEAPDDGTPSSTKAHVVERIREEVLESLSRADAEGLTPITQTDLLKPVTGNQAVLTRVLKALVEEVDSPFIMKPEGKKNLYSLRH